MKKRFFSLFLVLSFCFALAVPVFAADFPLAPLPNAVVCPYCGEKFLTHYVDMKIVGLTHDYWKCWNCGNYYEKDRIGNFVLCEKGNGPLFDDLNTALQNTTVPAASGVGRESIVNNAGKIVWNPVWSDTTSDSKLSVYPVGGYYKQYQLNTISSILPIALSGSPYQGSAYFSGNKIFVSTLPASGSASFYDYCDDVTIKLTAPVSGYYTSTSIRAARSANGSFASSSYYGINAKFYNAGDVISVCNYATGALGYADKVTSSLQILSMPVFTITPSASAPVSSGDNTYTYNNNTYVFNNTDNSTNITTVVNNYTVVVNVANDNSVTINLPDNYPAPTATPAPTDAPTATPAPTDAPTATPAPTDAPTATPAPTDTPTATPAPTDAPTATPAPDGGGGSGGGLFSGVFESILGGLLSALKSVLGLLIKLLFGLLKWITDFLLFVNSQYLGGFIPAPIWAVIAIAVPLVVVLGVVRFIRGFF